MIPSYWLANTFYKAKISISQPTTNKFAYHSFSSCVAARGNAIKVTTAATHCEVIGYLAIAVGRWSRWCRWGLLHDSWGVGMFGRAVLKHVKTKWYKMHLKNWETKTWEQQEPTHQHNKRKFSVPLYLSINFSCLGKRDMTRSFRKKQYLGGKPTSKVHLKMALSQTICNPNIQLCPSKIPKCHMIGPKRFAVKLWTQRT